MLEHRSSADPKAVEAGQAAYSPLTLALYDFIVLGISNHLVWRCPTVHLRQLYDRHVGAHHLDIGVGTGYYLDKARWPVAQPSITLLDLNQSSLNAAAYRIRRFRPATVRANALEALPQLGQFESVGLCYLLHCVPGAIGSKAIIFDHLRPHLAADAQVFGATIVQGKVRRSRTAQALMNFYNTKGIFSNSGDTVEDLEAELAKRFSHVTVQLIGCVALFAARAK